MKNPLITMPLFPTAELKAIAAGNIFAMARIGTNMNVQVENTLGTPITDASAITKASPPEVTTAAPHGLSDGDIVRFTSVVGMVELEGQAARVSSSASTTFELEGLDSTTFSTFTSCVITEITAFHTLSNAQSVSMPDPSPNKIDTTTLIDKSKQNLFGLPEAPDGSIGALYDPANTGVVAIKAATVTNTELVFKVNWAGGESTIFNAQVSHGGGFELAQNDAAKATISFTPVKTVLDFAT
jgi:hypothetical protein